MMNQLFLLAAISPGVVALCGSSNHTLLEGCGPFNNTVKPFGGSSSSLRGRQLDISNVGPISKTIKTRKADLKPPRTRNLQGKKIPNARKLQQDVPSSVLTCLPLQHALGRTTPTSTLAINLEVTLDPQETLQRYFWLVYLTIQIRQQLTRRGIIDCMPLTRAVREKIQSSRGNKAFTAEEEEESSNIGFVIRHVRNKECESTPVDDGDGGDCAVVELAFQLFGAYRMSNQVAVEKVIELARKGALAVKFEIESVVVRGDQI